MFKNKNQAISSVELAFSQFMEKTPKQKSKEVRKILYDNWLTSQSQERLIVCLKCVCSYFFKPNKMDNQELDLLKANMDFWKLHTKDIYDRLTKIIQMMKNEKEQKRSLIGKMIGKESFTSFSNSETDSNIKKSVSSRTDVESFITFDQYQNEVKVLKQVIRQRGLELDAQKAKNEELMQRVSGYKNKLQDYEMMVIRMKKSIMAIKQEMVEIKRQHDQVQTYIDRMEEINKKNNSLNMEQVKIAIMKYNEKLSNKIQKQIQKQKQKQKQNNENIIKQIRNISRQSIINWQSNKQSSNSNTNHIMAVIQDKIVMLNCFYLEDVLHSIKYGSNGRADRSDIGLNQFQQQIVDRFLSLQKDNQDMHAKINLKQDDKISNRCIIAKQPTLSFMWSHILPILNTSSQELAVQAYKQQQNIIKIVENYYKNSKTIQFMKLVYSMKELSGISCFHTFVDDYPNLLLLVRLKNGTIIGAYSEAALSKGSSAHNRSTGFLFQCKNNKVFLQRQKFRNGPIMPYNQYHIIVGNHDIKIFQDTNCVESSFGKQNSMFRPSSEYSTNDLLFEGEAEKCELIDIEFYSIFFK